MEVLAVVFSTIALCISCFAIFYVVKRNELERMIKDLSDKPVTGKYPRNEKGLLDNRIDK